MMKTTVFARHGRQLLLCAAAALAITGSALAQSASAGTAQSAPTDEGGYAKWEISPYVGWQWFQAFQSNSDAQFSVSKFNSALTWGERFSINYSRMFAVQASMSIGYNHMELKPLGDAGFLTFNSRDVQMALDHVIYFEPRTARTRLFMLAGPGFVWYLPGALQTGSGQPYVLPGSPLTTKGVVDLNYGVGVERYFSRGYGIRFDVGGLLSSQTHYGLLNTPTVPGTLYITQHGRESALTATVGLVMRLGYVEPPPPPNPLVSQTLRVDVPAAPSGSVIVAGAHDVCPGDDLRLTANAAGFPSPTYQWSVNGQTAAGATGAAFSAPTATGTGSRAVTAVATIAPSVGTSAAFTTEPGHTYHLTAEAPAVGGRTASYQWLVNGQPVAGATSSSIDLPVDAAKSVTVRVSAANPPATSASANFTIRPLTPPTLTFAVNPTTVPYTAGPIALAAVATASQCGGPVRVTYSGQGVTGSSFNPGSVTGFDMGNRVRQQTHAVTITATATDAKNQTVSRTANVTVTLGTEARRLDDVVFQSMSSRVNNCGKRLLLEELTPMLRNDPGAKVILIGHRDEKEKGRVALTLDTKRVLNAAAVLSAGKGICPQLDLSRIMMKAVGTDQSSTPRPALCGSSTNVKEKSGQAVKESDTNAEYRRVEVWFVPSGAADPAGVTGLTPVPAADVQKLGCPK